MKFSTIAMILPLTVKALMVVHDLRVFGNFFAGYHITHHITEGAGQVMGLSLAQHLGQITLRVNIDQQDFLAVCGEAGGYVRA